MKLKCLLVDDEPPALEILRTYISAVPALDIAGECFHGMDAFNFLQHTKVDLIFLDVQMPRLLGTDLIKSLPHPPRIIFTTAHREFATDGFDLNAVDYLLKPYSFDRFLKAIHKALQQEVKATLAEGPNVHHESERFLYFRADRKMVKVKVDDIIYVESLRDYVKIFTTTQSPILTKQTISSLEDMLPADYFLRVHRSFIIALAKVSSYTPQSVYLGKTEIPVGPLYKSEVIKSLLA